MSDFTNSVTGTITEEQRVAEIKRLEASYLMYEKAKVEMVENRKNLKDQFGNPKYTESSINSTMEMIDNMQRDIVDQYIMYGGDEKTLKEMDVNTTINTNLENDGDEKEDKTPSEKNVRIGDGVMEYLESISDAPIQTEKTTYSTYKDEEEFDVSKVKEQFDVIPLPSKGECYANKMKTMPVSYLTAYDENIIVSPNLYRDGTFIDVLLRNKVLNPAVDPKDLLPGDRDAIILWLRATGYGNEFPVTVTDDQTGKEFSTVIDLSKINYKEFTLKGDENGWFEFITPTTKDKIKFAFLTYGENVEIMDKDKEEDVSIKKEELLDMAKRIEKYKNDSLSKTYNKKFTKRIEDAISTLEDWHDNIVTESKTKISHTLTNRLIKMIKSVNGVTDRKFIKEYVVKMNIRDSSALRKYVIEHEPGLDFNIEVERPQSLGGGSMTTFLTFDQFIFLNIA